MGEDKVGELHSRREKKEIESRLARENLTPPANGGRECMNRLTYAFRVVPLEGETGPRRAAWSFIGPELGFYPASRNPKVVFGNAEGDLP